MNRLRRVFRIAAIAAPVLMIVIELAFANKSHFGPKQLLVTAINMAVSAAPFLLGLLFLRRRKGAEANAVEFAGVRVAAWGIFGYSLVLLAATIACFVLLPRSGLNRTTFVLAMTESLYVWPLLLLLERVGRLIAARKTSAGERPAGPDPMQRLKSTYLVIALLAPLLELLFQYDLHMWRDPAQRGINAVLMVFAGLPFVYVLVLIHVRQRTVCDFLTIAGVRFAAAGLLVYNIVLQVLPIVYFKLQPRTGANIGAGLLIALQAFYAYPLLLFFERIGRWLAARKLAESRAMNAGDVTR